MSTIKVKDNRKRSATQIKNIATSKVASQYDSNELIRVPRKKRGRTGIIPNRKQQRKKTPKHNRNQCYCIIFKKAGIPDQNYILHSSYFFYKRSDQHSFKDWLGGYLGNRADSVKKYKNSEQKWKKDLKSLKNQNKMLYIIAKESGSYRALKRIKKILSKASQQRIR